MKKLLVPALALGLAFVLANTASANMFDCLCKKDNCCEPKKCCEPKPCCPKPACKPRTEQS